ncbi:MAG: SPOR domain-containing protein [Bacteroidales bacterium]|nr:SPOR domain-containing protein [Bacteroidales bacterium]MBN2749596.1 SPOR domain-containing protein [Bacteroidales bacterium]
MDVNRITRELLISNNYVSLPTIGSFVQRYEPARLKADGKTFTAPKQVIIFDTSRTFNDEAIELYLCEKLGISPSKAAELLKNFIDTAKEQLSNSQEVFFENVGTLKKDNEGTIIFTPVPEEELSASTFGLGDIEATPTKNIPTIPKKPEATTIKSTKRLSKKKVAFGVLGLLAAIAVLAVVLIPELHFWEKPAKRNPIASSNASVDTTTIVESAIDSTLSDTLELNPMEKSIDSQTQKKQALLYEEPKPQDNRAYYVIAGSFISLDNAKNLQAILLQKGFKTEVIESNGKYRVSMAKFSNKERATEELIRLHQLNPKDSYWILGQ